MRAIGIQCNCLVKLLSSKQQSGMVVHYMQFIFNLFELYSTAAQSETLP